MMGGSITGNTAGDGGGIYVDKNGILYITAGEISKNATIGFFWGQGGGICTESGAEVHISNAVIEANTSERWAGGCALNSEATIENSTIKDNTSKIGGGGILSEANLNISNTEITGNKSDTGGGGIFMESGGVLTIDEASKIYNNTAAKYGSDLYLRKAATGFKLDAASMDEEYQKSGVKIDGWYSDKTDNRYIPSTTGTPVTLESIQTTRNNELVASYKIKEKVTVSYSYVGTTPEGAMLPDTEDIDKGTAYTAASAGTVTGYTFDGWYTDDTCSTKFTDGTAVNASMTLYGQWTKNEYSVSYVFKEITGRTLPEKVLEELPEDSTIYYTRDTAYAKKPASAVVFIEGDGTYTFDKYDKTEAKIVDEDITFTGYWTYTEQEPYTVEYSFTSTTKDKELPETVLKLLPKGTIAYGGDIVEIEHPSVTTVPVSGGIWSFTGYDIGGTAVTGDKIEVVADTVINGSWKYTEDPKPQEMVWVRYKYIGYVPKDPAEPSDKEVLIGTAFTADRPAEKKDYTFDGWYTDDTFTTEFEDGTIITKDTILYGRWIKDEPVPGGGSTHNRGSDAAGYGTTTVSNQTAVTTGSWQKDSSGRFESFIRTDGVQIKDSWAYIANPAATAGQAVYDWYRFDANGDVVRGWYKDTSAGTSNVRWYYLDDEGANMLKGWHYDKQDGKWYYLDLTDGHMLTGWQLINGKWYLLNSTAHEQTWNYDGSGWSYNGSSSRPCGSMYAGETTPDGYSVDANGAWDNQPKNRAHRGPGIDPNAHHSNLKKVIEE